MAKYLINKKVRSTTELNYKFETNQKAIITATIEELEVNTNEVIISARINAMGKPFRKGKRFIFTHTEVNNSIDLQTLLLDKLNEIALFKGIYEKVI